MLDDTIKQDWYKAPNWELSKRKEMISSGEEKALGNIIFVFAGGTSRNYLDFTREDTSLNEQMRANFVMAKGPDFVSRLRGHINILGPNPVDEYDDAYVIRRSLLLRHILRSHFKSQSGDNIHDKISDELVRVMLSVSRYKHGARSIKSIINMLIKLGGNSEGKYVVSSLPTLPQLNMHVDGKEFIDLLSKIRRSNEYRKTCHDHY